MKQQGMETLLIWERERDGVSLHKRYIGAREYMRMRKLRFMCNWGGPSVTGI